MSAHARLGPSSASQWLACPASVDLAAAFENKSNSAAEEGTLAHEVVETILLNWRDGTALPTPEGVNEEMTTYCLESASYVINLVEAYQLAGVDCVIYIEERVDLHYYTGRKDMWGTADIVVEAGTELHVIDFKYGSGIYVPAIDNPQLKIYALGAMSPNAEERGGNHGFKDVTCTIIQPRNTGSENEAVRSYTYQASELEEWASDVLAPGAALTDGGSDPVAGESQCRWCRAKSTCPAVTAKALALCSAFEPVQKVEDLSTLANASPDTLNVEQLVAIVENAPFVTGWLKAVNDRVRQMLEDREEVPGLKLVRGRQMNKWSMPDDEILDQLSKGKGHIPKKDLQAMKLITAPAMLKNKALKPAQKKRMQEYIKKSEGTLSIASESDERPNAMTPIVFEKQYDFL